MADTDCFSLAPNPCSVIGVCRLSGTCSCVPAGVSLSWKCGQRQAGTGQTPGAHREGVVTHGLDHIPEEDLGGERVAMVDDGLPTGPLPAVQLHTAAALGKGPVQGQMGRCQGRAVDQAEPGRPQVAPTPPPPHQTAFPKLLAHPQYLT